MMKLRGMMCMISRLGGTLMVLADSTARTTSSVVMTLSGRVIATTPLLFTDVICVPVIPTRALTTLKPLLRSAFSTELRIESTASSMSMMTPFRSPFDCAMPTPMICASLRRLSWPTRVQTLVVPTSIAAMTLCLGTFLSPTLDQKPTPDNGQVVEQAHAERDDSGQVELDAQPVGQIRQESRQQSIEEEAGQEHLVIESTLCLGSYCAHHRVQPRQNGHGDISRVRRRHRQTEHKSHGYPKQKP